MFALIDCNNFYASCERLFRPDLRTTPIIVLSNNDGCVIARSNEAKALGIKMGVPYFEVKALCKQHQVQVFSSNYTLYGDLSSRVMTVIGEAWDNVEYYSIDEAFLNLATLPKEHVDSFCEQLQRRILQWTGIPTSIGIGCTKTLAKAANFVAKKKLNTPVVNITGQEAFWLAQIDVGDVWGIGQQWQKKLSAMGINSAFDLSKLNPALAKARFNVVMQRTVLELTGLACLDIESIAPKKSIMSSCSFGGLQTDYEVIQESVSHHCATAWGKMRKQGLMAGHLTVFVRSNPFRQDTKQYANAAGFQLIRPTDDIRELIHYAKQALQHVFKKDIHYHKCGVLLADLMDKQYQQIDIFNQPSDQALERSTKLMDTLDKINAKLGARTIRIAAEGFEKEWSMKRQLKSPHYTTRWSDLPIAYCC